MVPFQESLLVTRRHAVSQAVLLQHTEQWAQPRPLSSAHTVKPSASRWWSPWRLYHAICSYRLHGSCTGPLVSPKRRGGGGNKMYLLATTPPSTEATLGKQGCLSQATFPNIPPQVTRLLLHGRTGRPRSINCPFEFRAVNTMETSGCASPKLHAISSHSVPPGANLPLSATQHFSNTCLLVLNPILQYSQSPLVYWTLTFYL